MSISYDVNHYTTGSSTILRYKQIPAKRAVLAIINKKENLPYSVFCCSGGPDKKIKVNENRDKYLDLARELRKLCNMRVKVILPVIGALLTVSKGLEKWLEELEIGGRIETIHATALLKFTRILRKVLETRLDFCQL